MEKSKTKNLKIKVSNEQSGYLVVPEQSSARVRTPNRDRRDTISQE